MSYEEIFYISEYDRRMAEIARLHENDHEKYFDEQYIKCKRCKWYDEWAGCTYPEDRCVKKEGVE